jgi:hypothetical protein
MAFLAFILGSLLALTGAVGVVAPGVLATLASMLHGPFALGLATVLRLVLGAALVVAAPPSRAPTFFRGLGVTIFTLGLLTPLIGVARFDAIIDEWTTLTPWRMRLWSGFAGSIGGAIAYGIIPRSAR